MLDEIPSKNIIMKNKHPEYWFGHDYNMNLYKGCFHGCIYCDSRSDCYQIDNFDEVSIKKDAIAIIKRQLSGFRHVGVIGTGSMSDPYNSYEKEYKLTKKALILIEKYGFGVGISTKSNLVARDINILRRIQQKAPVTICLTITAADDEVCKRIEPNVSLSSERFEVLRKLSDEGIYCGILMMPLLPGITGNIENVREIIFLAKRAKVDFIYPSFGFTMRDGNREYLYHHLDKHYPGYKEKYIKLYGDKYVCNIPKAKEIRNQFIKDCNNSKISYEMDDIIKKSKDTVSRKQLMFFEN
ncbi:MAG: radical SAM protein [Clostridiales bacterium]|nr:radical SAM protein [Clostridiales bacterium]